MKLRSHGGLHRGCTSHGISGDFILDELEKLSGLVSFVLPCFTLVH